MKISYNWLKQIIKLDWDAEKTGELLTDLGLEVEGITPYQNHKIFKLKTTSLILMFLQTLKRSHSFLVANYLFRILKENL